MSAPAAKAEPRIRPATPSGAWPPAGIRSVLIGAVVTALILVIAVLGGTARGQEANTQGEILAILCGGAVMAAAMIGPRARRLWGLGPVLAFGALVVLAAASTAWSVAPSDTWVETNRALAHFALFAGAVAAARLAPRDASVLVAVILAATAGLCAYALLTKVFPAAFDAEDAPARLSEPLGYWNATGLIAAIGIVPALWLATRRVGPSALRVAAYPIAAVLTMTLVLSYSRGSLAAAVLGTLAWLLITPRRLRSVALIVSLAVATGPLAVWAFERDVLTSDPARGAPIDFAGRADAGHDLGIGLLLMLAAIVAAGIAVERLARNGLHARLRRGITRGVVGLTLLASAGGVAAVAVTGDGIGGRVSEFSDSLSEDRVIAPLNDPSRLKSMSAVRGRYWHESLRIWQDNRLAGAGYGTFSVARDKVRRAFYVEVNHAHGQLFELVAGLGALGLLCGIAFLGAWVAAARRTLGLQRGELGRPHTPERLALTALGCAALIFGFGALIDWTFVIPGVAAVGLLAAGFVAGRGPYGEPLPQTGISRSPTRIGGVILIGVLALCAAWAAWQPYRSASAVQDSYEALTAGEIAAARQHAEDAHDHNPLALEPLVALARATESVRPDLAYAALRKGARVQGENAAAWSNLAEFQLSFLGRPDLAMTSVQRALKLDPYGLSLHFLLQDIQSRQPPPDASAGPDVATSPVS